MLTISKLAKQFNISRTTLLYYEKEGLIVPANRSENGYRWYGDKEIKQLQKIVNYRAFGLSIPDIKNLLNSPQNNKQRSTLEKQFANLEQEIQKLKQQQLAIVNFLGDIKKLKSSQMTKEKWTEIMRSSGMNDEDMHNWHIQFERAQPEGHQDFLEPLGIVPNEIKRIRTWSKLE
ncbi:MAG: MerR family transcriptional regulator [Kangiellaceae bacterium]|nr:MerR family transcriptional regulator [Kangiellaceae bacterium]MCW9016161.1 MerR family transcriptional regulator [Kangiellaceae bacterium]